MTRRALLAAAGALALLAGCASIGAPTREPAGQHFSGRLSVLVDGDSQRSFSAAFELQGSAEDGVLSLATPLGTQIARAQWSPHSVELLTPSETRRYASLDDLAVQALGERVPIAALFDWLGGRPWPAAPSRALDSPTGFEQMGWRVDLTRLADGWVVATRDPKPELALPGVVVRTRLDAPS